ncbi:hypothetical protein PV08_01754 [Exophiala spinifera]|uniref:Bacteriophage T5 Orf172 DNA-binding domain-containing protein n=1 Tax=Exophiala spinifera TaxID=91928 RepID=A0A0D2CCE8_9EURO|nr:uncharacterized protein PV08_01754 [Exophiala spinifera]KIW21174.1 hypothetical protein PV08_01754 [Exophiala spinifera]
MKNYEYPRVRPPTSLQPPQNTAPARFSWMETPADEENRAWDHNSGRERKPSTPAPPALQLQNMEAPQGTLLVQHPHQIQNPAVAQQQQQQHQYVQDPRYPSAYTTPQIPVQVPSVPTPSPPQEQQSIPQPPDPVKQPSSDSKPSVPIGPDANPLVPTAPRGLQRANTNMAIVPPSASSAHFSIGVYTPSPQAIKGGAWQHAILWGCEALQNWLKRQIDNWDKQNDASNKPDEDSNGQEDVPNEQAEASNQLALKFFGHDLGDRCIAPNAAGTRCQRNVKQDNRDWRCNLRKILLSTDTTSSLFRRALEAYIISCTCHIKHNTILEAIQQYMPQWEDELIVYYQQKKDALVADHTMEAAAVDSAREDVENLEPFANAVEEQLDSDGEDDVHDDSNDSTTESGEEDVDAAESPHISRWRGGSSATPPRFTPYRRDENIWDLMIQPPSKKDAKKGSIYVLGLPGAREHLKIGYSKRLDVRLAEWKECCDLEYKVLWRSPKVRHPMRVEKILQIQFEKEREEATCPGKGKIRHNEFFKLEEQDARRAIIHWITWMKKLKPYEKKPPHTLTLAFVRTLVSRDMEGDPLLKCWVGKTWLPRRILTYHVDDWEMEGSASPMQPENMVGQLGSGKKKAPRQQEAGVNGTLSSHASRLFVRYGQSSADNTQYQEPLDSSKDDDDEAHDTRVTPSSSRNKRPSGPGSSSRGKKSSSTGDDDTPSKPARRPGGLEGARKSSSQLSKAASRSHCQDGASSTTPSRMGSAMSSLTLSRSPPSDDINGILED